MSASTAINCTQCGAGLEVLGGGRVRAHVCGYCGAELDAQDNYKVLRQFKGMKRPTSPFQIGMEGEIDGVRMTVIGTIGKRETHGGRTWAWVDHQIFSPTHGYAWLTWENGNVVLTRKIRKMPNPANVTSRTIEESESRPSVLLERESYTYYASGQARSDFVEGEFNFVPEQGDATRYVSFLGSERMLGYVQGKTEMEYEISTLLDRDAIFKSFGVEGDWPKPHRIHPLQKFERSENGRLARNLAFVCAGLCLIMALIMGFFGGRIATGVAAPDRPLEVTFSVTQPSHLVQIDITADVDNSWAWVEAEITDANDEPVWTFQEGVEYYHGYDDGSWSEGSQTSSVYLRMAEGTYKAVLSITEMDQHGRKPSAIAVTVWQGVVSTFWLWIGFVVFLLVGAWFFVQRLLHSKRRMAGSDWEDDD